jgi:polysaccharide pyruvyl transferase WcaK-like protein
MPNIVHFHYNTSSNVNIGDEAHVLAIQDALQARRKDLVITNFPISFLCYYQIPTFVPGARRLPLFLHNIARILRGTSYRRLIKTINQSDMMVIGGGGVYMDHLLPFNTALLEKVKVPIVVWGVGYNHNFGEKAFDAHQLKSIICLGKLARLQSVRDAHTFDFLTGHNVQSTLIGDPAVFLQSANIPVAQKTKQRINIAINIAAHGWKLQSTYQTKLIDSYVYTMHQLQQTSPSVAFHYFVHHPGELDVIDELVAQGVVFESIINSDARQTKAMYGAMDLTISMMLHSTILAFGEGVPAVCVGYDNKNKSFMELTRQIDQYIPVQKLTPATLAKVVTKSITSRKTSAANIRKTLQRQRKAYDTFADRVAELID